MEPVFFQHAGDFRRWLEANHETADEVFVGYYNVKSGKGGMTWEQSVTQALCFGWIDGVRRKIDEESYCNRFTPRRANSNWSAVNIAKVQDLTAKGLMKPSGVAAFEKRRENKSAVYAYENRPAELPAEMEKVFRADETAWRFFEMQSASYRRTLFYWVMSAKQEATRSKRLEKLIAASAAARKLR